MRLPTFKESKSTQKEILNFKGIDTKSDNPNFLYDAINLTGTHKCSSRKSRLPALFMDSPPDQIINFGEALYFRYGNTLSEINCDEDGLLQTDIKTYSLSPLSAKPDRSLISYNNCLCVLPDGLMFSNEEEQWYDFGKDCDIAVALPFINSKTLFYSSGYSGGEICNDVSLFKVGDKATFSWISGKEFTVCAVDTAIAYSNGVEILAGTRVTFTASVTNWDSLPSDASMKICTPKSRKLLNNIKLGINETVSFWGKDILFSDKKAEFTYEYSLKNLLYVGQQVKISGSKISANNKTVTITEIGDYYISFNETFISAKESASTVITITPIIPSFDIVTKVDERVIGVDNKTKTFWVSRSDEPFVFHKFPKYNEDSWCCNYPTEVTGLTVFKDSVIAFTKNGAFRLFGSDALNFGISQLHIMGMSKDGFDSFASVGDKMYYNSSLGIIEFNGSSDRIISAPLPDNLTAKCGTAYKGKYYLLTDNRLWVYDTEKSIWWSENTENIESVFFAFDNLYLTTQKAIYLSGAANTDVDWLLETGNLPGNANYTIKPSSLTIDAISDSKCEFAVYIKCDKDIDWQIIDAASLQGKKRFTFLLCNHPCKSFKIKLVGSGRIFFNGFEIEYRRI